jgi:hypothetical protein
VQRLIGHHSARIPQQAGRRLLGRGRAAGHPDLVGRLPRTALRAAELPAQARLAHIQADGIDQIFTNKLFWGKHLVAILLMIEEYKGVGSYDLTPL